MKKMILFAAAAALFAACSSDNDLVQQEKPLVQNETEDNLISFDVYTNRSTTTRAGWAGEVTTDGLKQTTGNPAPLGASGFGVFAYYTDNFDYTPLYQPNFMYNEQVTWQTNQFKYNLPKYWPNEHGSAAQSSDQDRVSFFAYTPYVEVDPSTGMLATNGTPLDASDEKLQWGITGMKRNTLQGDPIIQYITSFDQAKSVDLCWATTGSNDINWGTNNTSQTIKGGYPWLNVRKPNGASTDDAAKVRFNFQHALAKLAVTVKTDFTGDWTPTTASQTKVWVRSIRFTGIAQKAALNLNNPKTASPNKARWMDYYGTNELELGESVTVHDGRKDGSEGVAEAVAPNEAVLGLNPKIIQDENQITWNEGSKIYEWHNDDPTKLRPGVTTTPVNVFCNGTTDEASHIYVIPTGEKVNVEIVYDIETIDKKLPTMLSDGETSGSTVENRITKTITFGTSTQKLENGKSYTLNLILGLKDVQFTATVNESWGDGGSSDTYLPENVSAYAAGSTVPLNVAYNTTSISSFDVIGLTASVTNIDTTKDGTLVTAATGTTTNADGKLTVSGISLATANTTVKKQEGWIKVKDPATNITTQINVTREAKPFEFANFTAPSGSAGNDLSITIAAGSSSGTVPDGEYAKAIVIVEKSVNYGTNWTTMTESSTDDTDYNTYKRTNSNANIVIGDLDGLAEGYQLRVTIQVGDAPVVTSSVISVTN